MTPSVFSKTVEQITSAPQGLQQHILEFIRVLTNSEEKEGGNQQIAVKGTYQDGLVRLPEVIDKRNGQSVIVTFLDEPTEECASEDLFWNELENITDSCQISTGIKDLAAQHDHYIHGTPKREV